MKTKEKVRLIEKERERGRWRDEKGKRQVRETMRQKEEEIQREGETISQTERETMG